MPRRITLAQRKMCDVFVIDIPDEFKNIATEVGLYDCIWHPEETSILWAKSMVGHLEQGLPKIHGLTDKFPEETCNEFASWIEKYIEACKKNPYAEIFVSE